MEKIIYKCSFADSANYHLNKYKHWAKVLNYVDTTKTNGYAFNGEWLKLTEENLIPENSYVIELNDDTYYSLIYVTKDGANVVLEGRKKEFISFILECAKIVNKDGGIKNE